MFVNRDQLIQKALDHITGATLIPEVLNPVLTELAFQLNPLVALLNKRSVASDTYKFSQRTAYTAVRSISGEKATTLSGSSDYNRASVAMKVLKLKGGVYGLLEASSREYMDAYKTEIVGHVEKMMYDLENQVLHGYTSSSGSHTLTGDPQQFDGFEASLPLTSKFDGIGVVEITDLDYLLDFVSNNGARNDPLAFMMSTSMASKVSRLQTQILIQVQEVDIEGGWRFVTYRKVPIIESSFCQAKGTMGAIAVADAVGGALPDATQFFYRVAAITDTGETVACAEQSDTTVSPNLSMQITWSAYDGANSYMIFRSTTTNTETLLDVIPAKTYDSKGNVTGDVTSYTDAGAKTPDAQTKPMEANEESIYLINRHPDKGSEIPYANMNPTQKNLITFEEMAKIDDVKEFMIKCYPALAVRNPNVSARLRNVKIA